MMGSKRAGRPPKVGADGNGNFNVMVKGRTFGFRKGEDGKLRATGNPVRDEDFEYAKQRVVRELDATNSAV